MSVDQDRQEIKMKILIKILILCLVSAPSFAIELYQAGLSTRSQGMGGTNIAFARGTDAIFFNPAALAKTDGFIFNLATFGPAISTNAQTLYDSLAGSDAFEAEDVNELYGKQFFTDITAYGGLVVPYVGVGAYSTNTLLQSFNNPSFPRFNIDFLSDYAYVVGAAVPITDHFSFGVAGRHVKRWQGVTDILITDLIGSNSQDVLEANLQNKGKGNALDVAAMYSVKGSWNYDVAAVWKDVGDTKFVPTQGVGPDRQENNLMFGVAAQKDLGLLTWTNAFEYSGDVTKKLHLGTELSLAFIDLRAGYNQGYLSYGLGLDLWLLQLDLAAYTAELGATAGQTPNDRYQASLSFTLDFDQSFRLNKANGKKRRLLQRR
jgi:hypothetical protein